MSSVKASYSGSHPVKMNTDAFKEGTDIPVSPKENNEATDKMRQEEDIRPGLGYK